jgi:hypothetical protein
MHRATTGEFVVQWGIVLFMTFKFLYKHSLVFEFIKGILLSAIIMCIGFMFVVLAVWINTKSKIYDQKFIEKNRQRTKSESSIISYDSENDPCEGMR